MEQKVEAAQQRKQDASSEFADLSVKNHELCQELSHIDHLAKQLETDKELALQKAHQELQEAQVGGGGLLDGMEGWKREGGHWIWT